MAIQKEVTAITGKYMKDGQEKNRYTKLGVVMDTKNGPMLKLETIPLGWDGWAYLNDPKPREGAQTQAPKGDAAPFIDDLDSGVPF